MTKIRVEIVEQNFDNSDLDDQERPSMTTTISVDEIGTLSELEEFFRRIATAAGFFYVGEVRCKKYSSVHIEGEPLSSYERSRLAALLLSNEDDLP
jgi:hypothetical protein